MFSVVCARHPKAHTIVFVNDAYEAPISIKDSEHGHRYSGTSKNVYMKKKDKIPSSREFSEIFIKSQNKIRLQQFNEAHTLLETLGTALPVSETSVESMTDFTIKYVYKDKVNRTLAEARATKWKTMKKKSTLRIPPDVESHHLKVQRANYQV